MHAIEITSENLAEILQTVPTKDRETQSVDLFRFIASSTKWYFLTGYVTRTGRYVDWTIMPAYVFEDIFDYDAKKITTEWTQTVRKEAP